MGVAGGDPVGTGVSSGAADGVVLGGDSQGLFSGDGVDDGVALAGEVLGDYGANAGVVVAYKDCAFAAWGERRREHDVRCAAGTGKHDVEGGPEAEVALGPD